MEDEQNKSEKPSPHKLKQAKEKGQVSKSTEFNAVFSMIFFFLIAYSFSSDVMFSIKELAVKTFALAHDVSAQPLVLLTLVIDLISECFFIILPFLLLLMLFALLSNIFQIGFIFTAFTMKPDFTKLNPAKNIKNIFSKKTIFELFKSILKITIFAVFIYLSADYVVEQLLPLSTMRSDLMPQVWNGIFFQLVVWVLLLLTTIALLDFAFNKWQFSQKMMMSKHEVKEEHKKMEGDPEIKSKRKQAQKEMLKKASALSNVKSADVIVTNPTHIAIALQYNPDTMGAPKVLAMGKGELALKIRTLARRYQVPVVQNKPVARQLYKECDLDNFLPLTCYDCVAPIFRWLFAIREQKLNG